MLELVLRPDERKHLVRAAQGLRFLALDELHTYRGRQCAHVALLIRRLRDQCASDDLLIIGTSANMSSEGTIGQRQAAVAKVATRLFGSEVTPERVIGETLVRATPDIAPEIGALRAGVDAAASGFVPRDHASLVADPLAGWIETTFGLDIEPETNRLVRRAPTTVPNAAVELAGLTSTPEADCVTALRRVLHAASHIRRGAPGCCRRVRPASPAGPGKSSSWVAADRRVHGDAQRRQPVRPPAAASPKRVPGRVHLPQCGRARCRRVRRDLSRWAGRVGASRRCGPVPVSATRRPSRARTRPGHDSAAAGTTAAPANVTVETGRAVMTRRDLSGKSV